MDKLPGFVLGVIKTTLKNREIDGTVIYADDAYQCMKKSVLERMRDRHETVEEAVYNSLSNYEMKLRGRYEANQFPWRG